jgi:hypothetical protein
MLKYSIFILISLLFFSCGASVDEKTEAAVLSANIALGKGDCQSAINVLEANGRANSNGPYLKTLASAYACRAGYSTVTFFSSDISKTITPAPLGGTTLYSTSSAAVVTTLQNDEKFKDMQKAIDILLYAGGIDSTTEPTSAERAKYFSATVAGDIDTQLLYLVLAQLGRYMYYYGNADAAGVKGLGASGKTCFTSYVNAHATIKTAIGAAPGLCKNTTTDAASHLQLSNTIVPVSARQTRLCQGVVLLNGVLAILPNVISTAMNNPAGSAAVLLAFTAAKTALIAADPTTLTVATTMNQSVCENTANVTVSNLESYFGGMFESVFQ